MDNRSKLKPHIKRRECWDDSDELVWKWACATWPAATLWFVGDSPEQVYLMWKAWYDHKAAY